MIVDTMSSLKDLTSQEQCVVKYIQKHSDKVLKYSVRELAKESYTSSATIIRLCQKMGLSGYSAFKMKYVSEYTEMRKYRSIRNTKQSSIQQTADSLPVIYTKGMDETKSINDLRVLRSCIAYSKETTRMEIYGTGIYYEVAKIVCHKFRTLEIDAYCSDELNLTYMKKNQNKALHIIISPTRENMGMLEIARKLNESNQTVVCICEENQNNTLSRLCTESIYIRKVTEYDSISESVILVSILYIVDLLITGIRNDRK